MPNYPRFIRASFAARAVAISAVLALAAAGPAHAGHHAGSFGFSDDEDTHFQFAIPGDDGVASFNSTWSSHDLARMVRHQGKNVVWFSLDDRDYVVSDHAWVEHARDLVAPMERLGEQQSALGSQQSELGSQQSMIGMKQARLGAEMGRLGGRLGAMAERAAYRGDDDADQERHDIQRQMADLQRQMARLNEQQRPFREKQQALGARQAELGRQQREASQRASHELERLARQAIRDGLAKPIDDDEDDDGQ